MSETFDAAARERLGMRVRATWIAWAKEQSDIAEHPHWLTEWDQLSERDKEVDRRIGEDIAMNAANDLALENIRVAAQLHQSQQGKMDEQTIQALLDFWAAWHVGFDQVTPRDNVRRQFARQGIDGDAIIAAYRARIQPRIDAFEARLREYQRERDDA